MTTANIMQGNFLRIRNIQKLVATLVAKYSLVETVSILRNKYGVSNAEQFIGPDDSLALQSEPKFSTAELAWFKSTKAKYLSFKDRTCKTALKLKAEYDLKRGV